MATFILLSSNYIKNYYKVIMAFLVILIYCASNNTSSDYEIFNFEVNSKSAKPPPKKEQLDYRIQPGKYQFLSPFLLPNFYQDIYLFLN